MRTIWKCLPKYFKLSSYLVKVTAARSSPITHHLQKHKTSPHCARPAVRWGLLTGRVHAERISGSCIAACVLGEVRDAPREVTRDLGRGLARTGRRHERPGSETKGNGHTREQPVTEPRCTRGDTKGGGNACAVGVLAGESLWVKETGTWSRGH